MKIKIKESPLEAQDRHAEALMALAHVGRLNVFFFLVRAKREVAAGEIQRGLGLPAPTLSHHLNLLRLTGLIQRRKEKRYQYYSVNKAAVTDLVRLLTACC